MVYEKEALEGCYSVCIGLLSHIYMLLRIMKKVNFPKGEKKQGRTKFVPLLFLDFS